MRLHAALWLAVAYFGSGCGRTEFPFEMNVTSFRGLWTSPNDAKAPKGSLRTAQNVQFDRPGILEPVPGFDFLTSTSVGGTINAGTVYQGSIIVHYSTASIARWTGSAWSTYSGTFNPPDASTKPTFFEAEGSLFVLTAAGVYELDSPTGTWRLTGSPPALQGTATLRRTVSETGFATANGQWAYRVVWAYKNANDRLQLGAPSGRFILTAPANVTATNTNVTKANGTTTVTVASTTHGFATGEYVDVTLGGAETYFAAGRFQVTVVSSTSFTYSDAVNNGSGVSQAAAANVTYGFTSRDANLTIPVPSGVDATYFAQVYRSPKSADANSEPSDNLALVYERSPTNLEIAAGSMTIKDISPDELRGATLYTSLGTLVDAKERPPLARDACLFEGTQIYANVEGLQRLTIQILAVGGTNGLGVGDYVVFSDSPGDPGARTWADLVVGGSTENLATGQFQVFTSGSVSQNIANTAKSFVRAFNAYSGNDRLYAAYASTDTEAPGRILLYARSPTAEQFTAWVESGATGIGGRAIAPALPTFIGIINIARAGTTVTVNTSGDHGFAVGQTVTLTGSSNTTNFPNGSKTVATTPSTTSFTYTEAGVVVGAAANSGFFYDQSTALVISNDEAIPSAFMWSKPGEPWAVPLVNLQDIGRGTILRCIPSRDKVLLLTDQGVYQLTGDGIIWNLDEFDSTLDLKAYRTAVAGGGRVYGLTEQGFVEMLDSARIVSTPIEKTLRDLLATAPDAVAARAFAVANDAQRKVYLFLPDDNADTSAAHYYIYHTDSGDWTGPRVLTDVPALATAFLSNEDDVLRIAHGGLLAEQRVTRSGVADQRDPVSPSTVTTNVSSVDGNVVGASFAARYIFVGARVRNSTVGSTTTVTAFTSASDGSSVLLTLASAAGYNPGDTLEAMDTGILTNVECVDQDNEDPGSQKLWHNGSLAFDDSRFASAGLAFWTDLSPTYSDAMTLAPPGGSSTNPKEIDFWVARSWMRGTRIRWKFTHSTALERFALQGYTLKGQTVSARTTR